MQGSAVKTWRRLSHQALMTAGHGAGLDRVAGVPVQLRQLLQLRFQLHEGRTVLGLEGPAPEEDFLRGERKGFAV